MRTFWENERRKLLGQPLIQDDDNQPNTAIDAPQVAVLAQEGEDGTMGQYYVYAYDLSGLLRFKIRTQNKNEIFLLSTVNANLLADKVKRENPALKEKYGYLLISNNKEEAIATIYEHAVCYVGDSFLAEVKAIAEASNLDSYKYKVITYYAGTTIENPDLTKEIDKYGVERAFLLYYGNDLGLSLSPIRQLQIIDISDLVMRDSNSAQPSNSQLEDINKNIISLHDNKPLWNPTKFHIIGYGHTHPIGALKEGQPIKDYAGRNRPTYTGSELNDLKGIIRSIEKPTAIGGYISAIVNELGFMFYPTVDESFPRSNNSRIGYSTIQHSYIHVFDYNKKLVYEGKDYQAAR